MIKMGFISHIKKSINLKKPVVREDEIWDKNRVKIISITGMPGAGKKIVRTELEKKGIPVVVMRHVVENKMRERGIEVNNRNLRDFATELRKRHGMDIVARECVPLIQEKNSDMVILDGIRSYEEVEFLKRKYGNDFYLIAIHSSSSTRFNRLRNRGKEWDMKNWEEFEWRDEKELSWGLGKSIAKADFMIVNEKGLKHVKKQTMKILKVIL